MFAEDNPIHRTLTPAPSNGQLAQLANRSIRFQSLERISPIQNPTVEALWTFLFLLQRKMWKRKAFGKLCVKFDLLVSDPL